MLADPFSSVRVSHERARLRREVPSKVCVGRLSIPSLLGRGGFRSWHVAKIVVDGMVDGCPEPV